jgi:redox-sensitive bicupin YhaK (pirin superfamily)
MTKIIHRAESRGHANHGWLDSWHSFSFANYHNPARMNFGALRVLNDDCVAAGQGFETHPHKNMEIVSIPLTGELRHKDSFGNETVIKSGEVQIMSAGTGITHSEFNYSDKNEARFLQIWILPRELEIKPRYDQLNYEPFQPGVFQTLVSPLGGNGDGVKINQDAYFSMAELAPKKSANYEVKNKTHGVYIFVISGEIAIDNEILKTRDAMGLSNCEKIEIVAQLPSKILAIEVPIQKESA